MIRLLPLLLLLSAGVTAADTFVRDDIIMPPQVSRFSVCHGHSCELLSNTGFNPEQWNTIRKIFSPSASNAEEERRHVAQAIALMEQYVGAATGTAGDRPETLVSVDGIYLETQMDCIDESTNTTIYLTLLQNEGLLAWHRVADRATRGYFIFGWPHTTAVMRENDTGRHYAVDSWFEANGRPPHILPLATWQDGWRPR